MENVDSRSEQKAHLKIKSFLPNLYSLGEKARMSNMPDISCIAADYKGLTFPHLYPLVLDMDVYNNNILRVLNKRYVQKYYTSLVGFIKASLAPKGKMSPSNVQRKTVGRSSLNSWWLTYPRPRIPSWVGSL